MQPSKANVTVMKFAWIRWKSNNECHEKHFEKACQSKFKPNLNLAAGYQGWEVLSNHFCIRTFNDRTFLVAPKVISADAETARVTETWDGKLPKKIVGGGNFFFVAWLGLVSVVEGVFYETTAVTTTTTTTTTTSTTSTVATVMMMKKFLQSSQIFQDTGPAHKNVRLLVSSRKSQIM